MNPLSPAILPDDPVLARAALCRAVRDFFHDRGFIEVDTPSLIPTPDPSPQLESFLTRLDTPDLPPVALALRTSPEFCMKRLLSAGYERIFEIGRFFRNGETSPLHNPEFLGLEWYLAGGDYNDVMELTEGMILELAGRERLTYQGRDIDLSPPWERLTIHQAFRRHADLSLPYPITADSLREACRERGLTTASDDSFDDLFFRLFITFVEPHLGRDRATFLLDYPLEMAALARAKPDAPGLAERVELYIANLELANGYSELTDPAEQRRRFEEEIAFRRARGEEWPWGPDLGLLVAQEQGMPDAGGVAVGLDRLLMLLADKATIREVMPFPCRPQECKTPTGL